MWVWILSPAHSLCPVSWRCSEWGRRVRPWVAPRSRSADVVPNGRKDLAPTSHRGGQAAAEGLPRPGEACSLVPTWLLEVLSVSS